MTIYMYLNIQLVVRKIRENSLKMALMLVIYGGFVNSHKVNIGIQPSLFILISLHSTWNIEASQNKLFQYYVEGNQGNMVSLRKMNKNIQVKILWMSGTKNFNHFEKAFEAMGLWRLIKHDCIWQHVIITKYTIPLSIEICIRQRKKSYSNASIMWRKLVLAISYRELYGLEGRKLSKNKTMGLPLDRVCKQAYSRYQRKANLIII